MLVKGDKFNNCSNHIKTLSDIASYVHEGKKMYF